MKKMGKCILCEKYTELTKEHVPPKKSGMATVFYKFYKVQNFFPYAIPIVLDNEPPRM